MAHLETTVTKEYTLVLSEDEIQAISALVAHVAGNPACYAIGSVLDKSGVEYKGVDLEFYSESKGRIDGYGYIKFPN